MNTLLITASLLIFAVSSVSQAETLSLPLPRNDAATSSFDLAKIKQAKTLVTQISDIQHVTSSTTPSCKCRSHSDLRTDQDEPRLKLGPVDPHAYVLQTPTHRLPGSPVTKVDVYQVGSKGTFEGTIVRLGSERKIMGASFRVDKENDSPKSGQQSTSDEYRAFVGYTRGTVGSSPFAGLSAIHHFSGSGL